MNKYEERQASKELREKYREKGREIAETLSIHLHTHDRPMRVTTPDHGNVHPVSDGAFVEATIWIPRELLDENPTT